MKTKILNLILLISVIVTANAQEKLVTRTGKATFSSVTPMEKIEAKNNQVASILMKSDHQIAFNVLLKSFKFDKALMEEHFNEKYVHSDKYPSAKFKGSIPESIDLNTPKAHKNINIDGQMVFHGVTKNITVMADIVVNNDNTINFNSTFVLKLEDYNVEIPTLVKEKISKDVEVSIAANYK